MWSIIPIALGAIIGANLRWLIGLWFENTSSALSVGILTANWLGALIIGICAECVQSPHWRLCLITGFLGSLTTFSSFSLEIVAMLQNQRWAMAALTTSLHVFGSLAFTALGISLVQWFK